MAIRLSGYTFDGPFVSTSLIADRSGVYVVMCSGSGTPTVIDVGESATVRSRLESHDRQSCWRRNCSGGALAYAVYYTLDLQQPGRMAIEQRIRAEYDPPCGKT
jgi:hypothetical protein